MRIRDCVSTTHEYGPSVKRAARRLEMKGYLEHTYQGRERCLRLSVPSPHRFAEASEFYRKYMSSLPGKFTRHSQRSWERYLAARNQGDG